MRWQYGFEINDHRVLDEYAYHYPKGRQALVFGRYRDDRELSFGPGFRSSGRTLARLVRRNALLLSVVGAVADSSDDDRQGVGAPIGPLFNWFRGNLGLMDSDNRAARITHTAKRLEARQSEAAIIGLLQAADLGITKSSGCQSTRNWSNGWSKRSAFSTDSKKNPGQGRTCGS